MAQGYPFERYLNVRAATAPALSPDGRTLAFLTNITGVPQVWSMAADRELAQTWPEQLTATTERATFVAWSPDADAPLLLFGMDTGGNERQQLFLLTPDGSTITPFTDAPDAIHTFGAFSHDGRQVAYSSNRRDFGHFDIYVQAVDAPGRENARLVYQAENQNTPVAFSPDGRYLLFERANTNLDADLYLLDLHDGSARKLTPHTGEASYSAPHFTPDGGALYLLTNQDREYTCIARLEIATGELRYIVSAEWDIDGLSVTEDATAMAYTLNENGYSRLIVQPLDADGTPGNGEIATGLPDGVIDYVQWAKEGTRLTFPLTGPQDNYNIWLFDRLTNKVWQATRSARAGIPRESLVAPRLVRFDAFDGLPIPAFYYLPQDARAGLPVVVLVHGGPESQERGVFNPVVQFLVGRGYAVLTPNVRGSSGYGKTYIHLDDVRKRMDSVADLKAAVAWLVAEGNADPARIAVMGGSYGGFMTLAAVTTYPDLWAAGVDIVGIANMLTFLERTSEYRRYLRVAEYGDPVADRDFLTDISPIFKADRITAPLMVLHGANDPRVPVGEAEQIVARLRELGRPVQYMRFEDEGHGIVKLKNRLIAYPAIGDFLDTWVRDKSGV